MKKVVLLLVVVACGDSSPGNDAGADASVDVTIDAFQEATIDAPPVLDANDATLDVADEDVLVEAGPTSAPWGVDVGASGRLAANAKIGMVATGSYDQYGNGTVTAWDASGSQLWTHGGGGVLSIAISPTGDVYAAAYAATASVDFGGGAIGTPGAVVVKYDAKGVYQWLVGPLPSQSYFNRVAVKSNGNVVALGSFAGTANFGNGNMSSTGPYWDVLLVELTSSKGYVRAKTYGGGGTQFISALAIDSNDDLVFAGTFEGDLDFGGGTMSGPGASAGTAAYIVELDSSASYLHQLQIDAGTTSGQVYAMDINAQGNIGVCGWFNDTMTIGKTLYAAGANDIFAAELDTSFGVKWSERFGDAQEQECNAAAFDSTGALVLGGRVNGNLNFGLGYLIGPNAFIVRLDDTGTALSQAYTSGLPESFASFVAPDLVALLGTGTSTFASIGNANATVTAGNAAALRFLPP